MTFSKYKKTVIACILALGIGVGGGYYFFGSPVNTQPTNVREQTKQTKPITETRNTYVVQAAKESGPAVVGITTQVFQIVHCNSSGTWWCGFIWWTYMRLCWYRASRCA